MKVKLCTFPKERLFLSTLLEENQLMYVYGRVKKRDSIHEHSKITLD